MIESEAKAWLLATYPELVPDKNLIAGTIQFSATYNERTNLFLVCRDDVVDDVGGIRLACVYRIKISEPKARDYSKLPVLRVADVEVVEQRHFRADGSACLCSPLEETDFLDPVLDFKRFVDQLVVPFLYGQAFYSKYNRWPWKQYSHYAVGLLESFRDQNLAARKDVEQFLALLTIDRGRWPEIRAVLLRAEVKGHTACFCAKHDHFRRCHPEALDGLRRLHQRMSELSIAVPAP